MTPKQAAIDKAIDAACDSGQILHRWQIEAFIATLAASGYTVVPVEATEEMLDAGFHAHRSVRSSGVGGMTLENQFQMQTARERACWAAMLAAAQKENG